MISLIQNVSLIEKVIETCVIDTVAIRSDLAFACGWREVLPSSHAKHGQIFKPTSV